MKYFLTIILLLPVSLASGQFTEVGIRAGALYNLTSNDARNTNPSYLAISPSVFIHFKSKHRISYELEAGYWGRERSAHYSGLPSPMGLVRIDEVVNDRFIDPTFTAFYSLKKDLPFQEKRTHYYIGVSVGALLNVGTMETTYTYTDPSSVIHGNDDAGESFVAFAGLAYLVDHSINKNLSINGLLSYRMLTGGDYAGSYLISNKSPESILSIKIGIGYKF